MKAHEIISETALGTEPKRPARAGSRPNRGHEPQKRYKQETIGDTLSNVATKVGDTLSTVLPQDMRPFDNQTAANNSKQQKNTKEQFCSECGGTIWGSISEHGKASRELCQSSKPDSDLGASMLSSCKSQGLRARDGNKSHKLGKSPDSRVKVGGHRIKGRKYGGPLPDWS